METDLLWNRISCYKNKQANKTNIEKKKIFQDDFVAAANRVSWKDWESDKWLGWAVIICSFMGASRGLQDPNLCWRAGAAGADCPQPCPAGFEHLQGWRRHAACSSSTVQIFSLHEARIFLVLTCACCLSSNIPISCRWRLFCSMYKISFTIPLLKDAMAWGHSLSRHPKIDSDHLLIFCGTTGMRKELLWNPLPKRKATVTGAWSNSHAEGPLDVWVGCWWKMGHSEVM